MPPKKKKNRSESNSSKIKQRQNRNRSGSSVSTRVRRRSTAISFRSRLNLSRNRLLSKLNRIKLSKIGTLNVTNLKVNGKSMVDGRVNVSGLTASASKTSATLWTDSGGRKMFINKLDSEVTDTSHIDRIDNSDNLIAIVNSIGSIQKLNLADGDTVHGFPDQITINLKNNPRLDRSKIEEVMYRLVDKHNRLNNTKMAVNDVTPSINGKTLNFSLGPKFTMDAINDFPGQQGNSPLSNNKDLDMSPFFNKKDSPFEQFKSDIIIMDQTLFKKHTNPNASAKQKKILDDQQQILKRQFVAIAALGIKTGNQKDPNSFQAFRRNVPLVSVISHGGRFAIEVPGDVDLANNFRKLLLTGSETGIVNNDLATGKIIKGVSKVRTDQQVKVSNAHAGLFQKRSTHPQTFKKGIWTEGSKKRGVINETTLGMNIPLGGIDNLGPVSRIKDEGRFTTATGEDSQHGHAFFLFDTHPQGGGRLMIGMESAGTGEGIANQVGSTHGIKSALGIGGGNPVSVTGQGKATKVPGLLPKKVSKTKFPKKIKKNKVKPIKKGALKSTLNANKYNNLKKAMADLDVINQSDDPAVKEQERLIMRKLLASTNKNQQLTLIIEMNRLANEVRNASV